MSWLSDLVSKKNATGTQSVGSMGDNKVSSEKLFISVDFTKVCFLKIDTAKSPNNLVFWKEVFTGDFEDLPNGKPVKDIFDVLIKILTQEKDVFAGITDVSVSLPADGVFFKTIEVPKMTPENMQKAVLGEIKKTLPVDFSQVLFAQNDLGEKLENQKTFFCVMIQKTMFEQMKNVFAKFGVEPYFEIEVFSLARILERDEKYKLIVNVTKTNTYLIFTFGQIIQEVTVLDMGDNKITEDIEKKLNIPFKDVSHLRERHEELHNEARMGAKVLDEFVNDFNKSLSKAISLSILAFEKEFNTEIKSLTLVGADASSRIVKSIHEEFDAELLVEFISEKYFDSFIADNFLESDIRRFAQCFGLAKRVK